MFHSATRGIFLGELVVPVVQNFEVVSLDAGEVGVRILFFEGHHRKRFAGGTAVGDKQ